MTGQDRPAGWRCAACGAERPITDDMPWRCPRAVGDDRHHVLVFAGAGTTDTTGERMGSAPDRPFERFDGRLAWAAHADATGLGREERRQIVRRLDLAVEDVAGVGFRTTPFARSDELSDALGFASDGGVFVKDETHGVAGSQKARHLVSILLHLYALDELGRLPDRSPLAIASCGNAALAAATLARAADWPIDVYVPTWMSDAFGVELVRLGAVVHRCERRSDDPPGDPAMHRFRRAVTDGAIPFTVQGPENSLALDGGRTIGWEMGEQAAPWGGLDRVFVQVGGGAFAACLGAGLADESPTTRLHAVQVEGCAPLERAWRRAAERGLGPDDVAAAWSSLMTPWSDPHSEADGILDDETYDWLGVFAAMHRTGGDPVVASEPDVRRAHDLAVGAGYRVSATGSAGLAGLLAAGSRVSPGERIGVVMSGVAR